MSLLMDLLSKAKSDDKKTRIPPDLRKSVLDTTYKKKTQKKAIILLVVVIIAVVAGFGTVYFLESMKGSIKARALKDKGAEAQRIARTEAQKTVDTETQKDRSTEGKAIGIQKETIKEEIQKLQKELPVDVKSISQAPAKEPLKAPMVLQKEPTKRETGFQKETETMHASVRDPTQRRGKDTETKDMHLYTARAYEAKGDYHSALSEYKKALELDRKNYIVMNNIAATLIQLGSFEESLYYAKSALEVKPNNVPALINAGVASIRMKNLMEGEGYLTKALAIEPSNRLALFNCAILYEHQKDFDKAYKQYMKLYTVRDVDGALGVARILERQEKKIEAVRIYRDILTMDTALPSIKKFANEKIVELMK